MTNQIITYKHQLFTYENEVEGCLSQPGGAHRVCQRPRPRDTQAKGGYSKGEDLTTNGGKGMRRAYVLWACVALTMGIVLVGCAQTTTSSNASVAPDGQATSSVPAAAEYHQISQDEAKQMMTQDPAPLIVDVRRPDEFNSGHIPNAINVPNEDIGTSQPEALPELDRVLLVYCRSGRRSKEAAQKLAAMGYTNVYEFGGINEWTGDVE